MREVPAVVIDSRKRTATEWTADRGHTLGAWERERSQRKARCVVCGAEVTVQHRDGSLSGPALTVRCKVPVPAGRAA